MVNWSAATVFPKPGPRILTPSPRQGFRYTRVYASAPVCAAQRSTWITGLNSISMGTHPMRSRYLIPHDVIKYYPDYLRAAGYYTANHTKTDYNIGGRPDTECWDSSVADAWNKRKSGQPFFQVINFMESHESKAQGDVTNTRHSPGDVTLRKYHPDEMGIRMNYAKYYDAVENMDIEVGKALAALDKAGLADDTIVIFNSDHGGVMPGSKRFLFDSGLHVPLIIRIPEKFKHLWPASAPGATVDRLVSFLDLTKTWLSLAGAEVPPIMQGRIFLGPHAEPEPEYVFSFRERMDERFDNERAVRDKHFAYIKNYLPYVVWGKHLEYSGSWSPCALGKTPFCITGPTKRLAVSSPGSRWRNSTIWTPTPTTSSTSPASRRIPADTGNHAREIARVAIEHARHRLVARSGARTPGQRRQDDHLRDGPRSRALRSARLSRCRGSGPRRESRQSTALA